MLNGRSGPPASWETTRSGGGGGGLGVNCEVLLCGCVDVCCRDWLDTKLFYSCEAFLDVKTLQTPARNTTHSYTEKALNTISDFTSECSISYQTCPQTMLIIKLD